jgi:protein phosphatase
MPRQCNAPEFFVSGKSDIGKRRQRNEDRFLINANAGVVLVADGMGGHPDGDKASEFAVQTLNNLLQKYLPLEIIPAETSLWQRISALFKSRKIKPAISTTPSLIRDLLIQTHLQLYRLNEQQGWIEDQGMGTTLVGCRIDLNSSSLVLFHVGDSRCYLYRQGKLEQLTKDHSAYQQWLASDQSEPAPSQNILWQTLGTQPVIEPDIQCHELMAGDRFLFCSDGLSNMVDEAKLADVLAHCQQENLEESVDYLIDSANEAGGRDNITAVIICL